MGTSEQRQHLGISRRAEYVISSDMDAFQICDSKSGFINTIFERFCDYSDATLFKYEERKIRELEELAKRASYRKSRPGDETFKRYVSEKVVLQPEEEVLIEKIARESALLKYEEMNSFPNETSFKARLRNGVYEKLYPDYEDDCSYGEGYERPGAYLKAVIEDYASRSFCERERFIYGAVYRQLETICEIPLANRPLIELVFKPANGGKSVKFDVRPYVLMTDVAGSYNYLACYSRLRNGEGEGFRMASFRLSRIVSIKRTNRASGKIPAHDLSKLKKAIADRGVEYLITETSKKKVLLTPNGQNKFRSIQRNRPLPKNKTEIEGGNVILEFDITDYQFKNYFFTFGADAVVLEPQEITDEFRCGYEEALRAYSDLDRIREQLA